MEKNKHKQMYYKNPNIKFSDSDSDDRRDNRLPASFIKLVLQAN